MRNFQDTFETSKRPLISGFSICMTVPFKGCMVYEAKVLTENNFKPYFGICEGEF